MDYLLKNHLQLTNAAFFGLILASSALVARMVQRWTPVSIGGLIAGAGFAFWLVAQLPGNPPEGNFYLFLCAMVAVCAMILPGISGAFLLLILGKYYEINGALAAFGSGKVTMANIVTLFVFLCGCVVGLLSFSKFLHWLLAHHKTATMAVLCGFMIGSLRKIWPFKDPTETDIRLKQNVWPEQFDGNVWLTIFIGIAAFGFVLLLEWWTAKRLKVKG